MDIAAAYVSAVSLDHYPQRGGGGASVSPDEMLQLLHAIPLQYGTVSYRTGFVHRAAASERRRGTSGDLPIPGQYKAVQPLSSLDTLPFGARPSASLSSAFGATISGLTPAQTSSLSGQPLMAQQLQQLQQLQMLQQQASLTGMQVFDNRIIRSAFTALPSDSFLPAPPTPSSQLQLLPHQSLLLPGAAGDPRVPPSQVQQHPWVPAGVYSEVRSYHTCN